MITIPLKLKYRTPGRFYRRNGIDPPEGTWAYQYDKHPSHSANSGKAQKKQSGTGHRRRTYGPW